MDVRVTQREGTELEFEVLGENETLLNPLKQRLLGDDDVDLAEYVIEHPTLSIPKIYLRTTGADPFEVVTRTVRSLVKETEDLQVAFDKAVRAFKK